MIANRFFNRSSRSILFFTLILFGLSFISGCSKDSNNPPVIVEPIAESDPEPEPEPEPDPVTESEVPVGPSILRINGGGEELTFDSVVFEEDKYFTGEADFWVNTIATEIEETEMDKLYLSERHAIENGKTFGYAIPVTNGSYTVKFHFAEIVFGARNEPEVYPGEEGRRIFSVDVEGENKIKNLDLFKEVGSLTAITRMYDVEVSDGELTIYFEAAVGRPMVSALEILVKGKL